jgi:hypothetical protein
MCVFIYNGSLHWATVKVVGVKQFATKKSHCVPAHLKCSPQWHKKGPLLRALR